MGDMLSQAEINALLGGSSDAGDSDMLGGEDLDALLAVAQTDGTPAESSEPDNAAADAPLGTSHTDVVNNDQRDILGEIGNISMGTAATTLFALLNQKVLITTPRVKVMDWESLSASYDRPCVGIRVDYRAGLKGSNILILKDRDVKIIADLMMGGTGEISEPFELTELDMSAIGEAMNQMVGSASTSLSSMVKQKVDIDTPRPFILNFQTTDYMDTVGFDSGELIVCVAFRMEVGSLIDSEIMQILPVEFAKGMVDKLQSELMGTAVAPEAAPPPVQAAPAAHPVPPSVVDSSPVYAPPPVVNTAPPVDAVQPYGVPPQQQPYYPPYPQQALQPQAPPPNVQAVQFQPFDAGSVYQQKENMGIIMDVPLEITVELGRTRKRISEILAFSPGTVIELDKLAGEPIDILVNGKFVAKGEVVVIDENFGIRITDIISVEKRI
jgi:flagellar motor switch protein FliN/FliY